MAYEALYAYSGTVPDGATALPVKQSYPYGSTVTLEKPPQTLPEGYSFFDGWHVRSKITGAVIPVTDDGAGNKTFVMPEGGVEITGTYVASGNASYRVEHYLQNADRSWPDVPTQTEYLNGQAGSVVTAQPRTFEGFTFDRSVPGTKDSGVITADGFLVLRLYYRRGRFSYWQPDIDMTQRGTFLSGGASPVNVSHTTARSAQTAADPAVHDGKTAVQVTDGSMQGSGRMAKTGDRNLLEDRIRFWLAVVALVLLVKPRRRKRILM